MLSLDFYQGREQTYIKHYVLERYLQKLAYKLGWSGNDAIVSYVDCFAGPWNSMSDDLADTSPAIAIRELQAVQKTLRERGRMPPFLKCLFIEKDKSSWKVLSRMLESVENIEVKAILGEFEAEVDAVLDFVGEGFAFFFIDPTGWTGYSLDVIRPMLRHPRCEILINFMTKFLVRFIDADLDDKARAGFEHLFGSSDCRKRWRDLTGLDREDAIVAAYCDRVREAGNFNYVAHTVVLDPLADRSHFHLIYATDHPEGLRTFRNEAERPAREVQRKARHAAQQHHELEISGQMGLFGSPARSYSDELEERYHRLAQQKVLGTLRSVRRVSFDHLEMEALHFPMTGTQDLKGWLERWRQQGAIEFEGLRQRARVPQPGKNHYVVYLRED